MNKDRNKMQRHRGKNLYVVMCACYKTKTNNRIYIALIESTTGIGSTK